MGNPSSKIEYFVSSSGSRKVRFWYDLATASGLAADSIRTHKLRSFLTLLGVIIGVASVVVVGSAIEGLGVYAEESTSKVFGSDTFLLAQVATAGSAREYFDKLRRNKFIRYDDVVYLQARTGDRILYSPYRQRPEELKHENVRYENGVVIGVSATLPEIRDTTLVEGRFFTQEEDRNRQFVAVIGDEVRAQLYPSSSAVGSAIKIAGIDFRVVGVLEKLGSSFGRSQDNVVYIPSSAFTRLFGVSQSFAVYGKPRPESGLTLDEALDLARVALRVRFRAQPNAPDNFDNITPDGVRAFIDNILSLISVVVVPVTCISLVVGGIVIMNIMLVSVTERTHEIGVRKSLGATPADIQLQFLLEAVLLSAIGGAVGILLGVAVTKSLEFAFEISLRVTAPYVALALVISSVVGVLSGWYPAVRASRLDPVVALRAE